MDTKIAIATGGGDCPGLNAVIRTVAKAAALLALASSMPAARAEETVTLSSNEQGALTRH